MTAPAFIRLRRAVASAAATGLAGWFARRVLARPGLLAFAALAALVSAKAVLVTGDLRQLDRPALGSGPGGSPQGQAGDGDVLPEPAAGPDEAGEPEEPVGRGEAAASNPLPAATPPAPFDADMFSRSELAALGELAERRRVLEERARALELRTVLLDEAAAKVEARLRDLAELKAAIETMIGRHEASEDEKFARLVKIYETMKPKAAAEIFDGLEMAVLVEVVSRMREATSSEVIGRMSPERARSLTAELARRRRLDELERVRSPAPTG